MSRCSEVPEQFHAYVSGTYLPFRCLAWLTPMSAKMLGHKHSLQRVHQMHQRGDLGSVSRGWCCTRGYRAPHGPLRAIAEGIPVTPERPIVAVSLIKNGYIASISNFQTVFRSAWLTRDVAGHLLELLDELTLHNRVLNNYASSTTVSLSLFYFSDRQQASCMLSDKAMYS